MGSAAHDCVDTSNMITVNMLEWNINCILHQ